jgi:hypothetical protein
MYFIGSSPLGGRQHHKLARWIVHPIVAAHEKNRQQARTIFISILGGVGIEQRGAAASDVYGELS